MRPWERAWFRYWSTRNTRARKDRPIHRLERALIVWPIHAYVWVKRRRQPETTTKTPDGVFFNAQAQREHE